MISLKELAEKAAINPKANKARIVVIARMIIEITMNKDAHIDFLNAFNAACGEKATPPPVRVLNPSSRAAVYSEVEAATTTSGKPCATCGGSTASNYTPTPQSNNEESEESSEAPRGIIADTPVAFDLDFFLTEVASQDEFNNKSIVAFLATKGIKYELPKKGFLPKVTLIERLRKQYIG